MLQKGPVLKHIEDVLNAYNYCLKYLPGCGECLAVKAVFGPFAQGKAAHKLK